MKYLVILPVLFVLAIVCGCVSSSVPMGATGQASPGDLPATAAVTPSIAPVTTIETPVPHSTYMYSTARGYKFHEAGFVCTDKSGTTEIYGQEGLIGIICEY